MRPALSFRPPVRAVVALALATLAAAPALRAQHAEVGVFSAWNPSLGDGLPLYGGSIGGGGAGIGMRIGGALRASPSRTDAVTGERAPAASAWAIDMDLVYDTRDNAWLSPIASALFGFSPSVFGGAGAMARRDGPGTLRAVPVFSYGGGVSRPIIGGLGLTSEARYRAAVRGADGSLPEGLRSGWEYRAGLALRFGGPRRGGGGGIPRLPIPLPGGGTAAGSARASAVIATADDYVGVPYVYGGATPQGFDCSGFVQYAFNRHGVRLPRTSRQQAEVGRRVGTSVGALQPGDLMFFSTGGSRVDHVAMYVGDNRMLHSSSSGGGVGYDDLGSSRGRWFVARMVGARRVVDGSGRSVVDAATLARLLEETVKTFDAPDRAPRR